MIDGPRVVPASGTLQSLVILLHGYGSNGDDLVSLAPHWRDALPATVFVAPNAPEPCPGAPGRISVVGAYERRPRRPGNRPRAGGPGVRRLYRRGASALRPD